MVLRFLEKITGTPTSRALKRYRPIVEKINALEPHFQQLSDAELRAKTDEFRDRIVQGATLDALLPEAFAVVREASRRLSGERHYDVQLLGGITLHEGNITEMRTGEGKTLVATLPAYLNALTGKGVHVVTVNDYLARRDAVWMGQIYHFLGLSVGVINSDASYVYDPSHAPEDSPEDETRDREGSFRVVHKFLRPVERPEAYAANITYGTSNEFGFDYLRDNIEYEPQRLRQRGYHFAIVDEVDSILIDEARTPLIISAPAQESEEFYKQFAHIAAQLTPGEDYTVDEKHKAVEMTLKGVGKVEELLGVDNLYTDKGLKYVHHLLTALKARALFHRDKHYVVRDNQIVIVDEFTGRLQPGRRWSEGLHQAIEAKEGVPVQRESRTYASVTFQNYFRMYDKLAGMTGTAETSAEEFRTVYGLDVIVIPTNRPVRRADHPDLIYKSEEAKFRAVVQKIKELHQKGQPVLVGTVSIEKNEFLSVLLTKEGVPHVVLNAKNHEREGEIIAQAGRKGAVTIATNMAGRGVDIKLGGATATTQEYEEVKELGGLFVIGTERHEARRIDNQLRGRAGRQGDPGETQFYVSLDDDLMRVFGSNDLIRAIMNQLPDDAPITHKRISSALEAAQKRIEGFHFDARKMVLAYDDVLNQQRRAVYAMRQKALVGDDNEFFSLFADLGAFDSTLPQRASALRERAARENTAAVPFVRRMVMQALDTLWMEHLETMEYLRSSVGLRAYGQRDPLIEYRREALRLFRELQGRLATELSEALARLLEAPTLPTSQGATLSAPATQAAHKPQAGSVDLNKLGRNDRVVMRRGQERKEVKVKKAREFIAQGWEVEGVVPADQTVQR
ncbi:preprotein translocase subunit SecA [Candidatus Parcubacteria bacterium]|nr:MAG: preprotein translocase subunit SecA [Candidatus Parcubacteria bacterium]